MPELPEVQTIVSDLQSIVGDEFTDFFSDFPKAIKDVAASKFAKEIRGQKISSISRLGKMILLKLGDKKNIAIHLKMTGKLLLVNQETWNTEQKNNRHLHHAFFLKKNGVLAFSDVRKFATISFLSDTDLSIIKSNYGIDPIADSFSLDHFSSILIKGRNRPIKELLMNNSLILGIGNIYASEILFDAHILPARPASSLNKSEVSVLYRSINRILTKAIRLRGTSVSDYRDTRGQTGSFQNHLNVYRRNTQKCKKCDTIVTRSVIGQRSTFFCTGCQH